MIETVSQAAVMAALRRVNDPELDESLVDLGFLDDVQVRGDRVEVVLRLPTFWCAPNFAYLMADDARRAILRDSGAREVRVRLKDHMYSDEISAGVSAGAPFASIFADQADGDDLTELRLLFARKAFGMRQEQLVRFLLAEGLSSEDIASLHVGDVLDTTDAHGLQLRVNGSTRLLRGGAPLARMYLARRERLGLRCDASAVLITDSTDVPLDGECLARHLQATRRQRISMTFNALMCRGLLETRYGLEHREEP